VNINMTKGYPRQIILIAILILVLVPAVILTVFAARGIDQQEAVIRRQLEATLQLELEQVNGAIRSVMNDILGELWEGSPDDLLSDDPAQILGRWEEDSPLVGLAYLLNEDGSIRIPELADGAGDSPDRTSVFYWRYLNFFSNNEPIPVYRNIAEVYEEEILSRELEAIPMKNQSDQPDQPDQREAPVPEVPGPEPELNSIAAESRAARSAPAAIGESVEAEEIFDASPEVQARVYEQAAEEGNQPLQRNVLPQLVLPQANPYLDDTAESDRGIQAGPTGEPAPQTVVRSVFIESTRFFQDLISISDYGLIPRIFDNSFILLYYEKRDGVIFGCELDMETVKSRIMAALAAGDNSLRYINVLDQGGRPLRSFEGEGAPEEESWLQPLLAEEISELLPYWETAVLLRDPEILEARIRDSRYFLGILIGAMLSAIILGLTLLFRIGDSRLRAVEQRVSFVTNVSHELKTPLTSIRMYSEMLSGDRAVPDEKKDRYLSHIVSESQRLSRLIGNVLDFAKLEKGSKVLNIDAVDLNSLVGEVAEGFCVELEEQGFALLVDGNPELPKVRADREAVIQVLLNLITNARKYSRDEKEIAISTGLRYGQVILQVEDRGIGIPRRYRRKIFKEFFRIDSRVNADTRGSGLGLSIARRLARAQGGDLVYEPVDPSDYTRGSRFVVRFATASFHDEEPVPRRNS
jgi:signal transduction histidine kinase